MRLARLNRRLVVFMSLAGLLAYVDGAGVETISVWLVAVLLALALFWQPSAELSNRIEKFWLALAVLLMFRAFAHGFLLQDDVVVPVVDLLLVLLAAESLRSLDAQNDVRVYSLSFALLLAATAYRPGPLFACAFVTYVTLGTVALMVGHLRRQAVAHSLDDIPLPLPFFLTTLLLSAGTLAFSVAVFLFFPRVSQGWEGRGETTATSIAGFSDVVSLGSHGARIYGNPQIILRVEFPDGQPADLQGLYWRGRSYDHFDGVRWSRSGGLTLSSTALDRYGKWGTETLRQQIYGAPLDTKVLFALHPVLQIQPDSPIRPVLDGTGDLLYWGSATPVYWAESLTSRPSEDLLRRADGGDLGTRPSYLQLPQLSTQVRGLADSLLADLPTDYDRVVRLKRWFQDEFSYTLSLPASPREATLEHFLLHRRAGHCEYFSTAMAVLLRTQGIPTREVNGFLGGEWSGFGEYLAVTQNQAHAWVEVWFPGYGWVPFDPTPSRSWEAFTPRVWFWPGRFAFDAMGHRWNKWVLDYSAETQLAFLTRGEGALRRTFAPGDGTRRAHGRFLPGSPFLWWMGAMAVVFGAAVALRRRPRHPPQARTFLRLRRLVKRAGAPVGALGSPMAIIRCLEAVEHPATSPAKHIVDVYLHNRFSGDPSGKVEGKDSMAALREAREHLRNRPLT